MLSGQLTEIKAWIELGKVFTDYYDTVVSPFYPGESKLPPKGDRDYWPKKRERDDEIKENFLWGSLNTAVYAYALIGPASLALVFFGFLQPVLMWAAIFMGGAWIFLAIID